MSKAKRVRQANLRKRAVRALRCRWDVRLGRDLGCHVTPMPCEHHDVEITDSVVTAPGERLFLVERQA